MKRKFRVTWQFRGVHSKPQQEEFFNYEAATKRRWELQLEVMAIRGEPLIAPIIDEIEVPSDLAKTIFQVGTDLHEELLAHGGDVSKLHTGGPCVDQ